MGLGLGLATTFLFTEGMKVSFGKPRPDLLARCSLDPTRIGEFALGGFQTRLPEYNVLVSWEICDQADKSVIRDGFQSFPSGHASCMSSPSIATPSTAFLGIMLTYVQSPSPA